MENSIFLAKGRINRSVFWSRILIILVLGFIIRYTIETTGMSFIKPYLWFISLFLSYFLIVQGVKRMHDLNKNGWYWVIPIYNLILTLFKGTDGTNNYGEKSINHKKNKKSNIYLGIIFILISGGCYFIRFIEIYENRKFNSMVANKMEFSKEKYEKEKITFLKTFENNAGSFVDKRDGQEYLTIKIGNQIWMAENLNFNMGDGCFYYNDGDSVNFYKSGMSYNYNSMLKVAPAGWHIPTDNEWLELFNFVGVDMNLDESTTDFAIYKLCANYPLDWIDNDSKKIPQNIINSSGFCAIAFAGQSPKFDDIKNTGIGGSSQFWSSTTSSKQITYIHIRMSENNLSKLHASINHGPEFNDNKYDWYFPVRCIKN